MNTRFKSALNHVKADEDLINKTEAYLRDTFAKEHNSRMAELKKWRMIGMKKFAIAACVAILLLGGGFKAYATPLSYVSLDINPSVELGVNALGLVVTAEGYNEDGKAILSGIKATGTNVKKAVHAVVDSAAHKGFIDNDGSTVVSLTAETDNDRTAAKLKAEAEAGADEALTENGKSADVNIDNVALARRDEARKLGITPGKLNLIQKLQAELQASDPTATVDVETYSDKTVKAIMLEIKEARQAITDKGAAVGNKDNAAVNNKDDGAVNNKDNGSVNNTNKGSVNSKANTVNNGTGGNKSTDDGNNN